MELLYAILVVLGVAALAELILWPKVYQRPPWGKRVFEWVLVPLLALISWRSSPNWATRQLSSQR
jgi:hypothetical protein